MEAPELYHNSFCQQLVPEKRHSTDNKAAAAAAAGGGGGSDHFIVEELLDFPNDDDAVITDGAFDIVTGNSTDSSTVTVVDSCNSSSFSGCEPNFVADIGCRSFAEAHFSSDLCVPYDDIAELEWLSNFVEESFSSDDLQKLQLISGMKARADEASEPTRNSGPIFSSEMSVPAKARSKRSRAAPCNWTSRLLLVSPTTSATSSSSSEQDVVVSAPPPPPPQQPNLGKKSPKPPPKKKESQDSSAVGTGDGRKCLHCATDKTPQWRTGPMGPKTLCNACGVRYKSGRLVPEYRPASSPTFVLTKHSNSHRKVLELRRQKEMMRAHQHQQQQFLHQNMVFDVSNGEDYLIHQHVGPDFRQMI